MNGGVIQDILENNIYTAPHFKGFCTPDLPLPSQFSKPAIFILNTDRWYGEGEHWCVANFISDDICEFFDSYGKPPCYYNFDKIMYAHVKHIVYNPFRVQGSQPTCGHHCLFFILLRYFGFGASFILNKLLKHNSLTDLERNDETVFSYIKYNYGSMYSDFIE